MRLRKQVMKSLGLNPVWSLASNKLVAKVASGMVEEEFGAVTLTVEKLRKL